MLGEDGEGEWRVVSASLKTTVLSSGAVRPVMVSAVPFEDTLRALDDRESGGHVGADFLVQNGLIGEDHIGGSKWLAVMPGDALTKVEGVGKAIFRDLPGFREGRLNLIPGAELWISPSYIQLWR